MQRAFARVKNVPPVTIKIWLCKLLARLVIPEPTTQGLAPKLPEIVSRARRAGFHHLLPHPVTSAQRGRSRIRQGPYLVRAAIRELLVELREPRLKGRVRNVRRAHSHLTVLQTHVVNVRLATTKAELVEATVSLVQQDHSQQLSVQSLSPHVTNVARAPFNQKGVQTIVIPAKRDIIKTT